MKPDPMRDALICAISDLSELYPSMRCGQIVEMIATLTGATTGAEMEQTSDIEMLREAAAHTAERSKQIDSITPDPPNLVRRKLLDMLRQTPFLEHGPLTRALMRIAAEMQTTLYDIEDDVLLERLKPRDAAA